ncbi:SipW-dependent-type signal peptide-containing protein [Lysinibacter cavernae]|uniref:Putative ribosomally synthesized peptide with SipW-like signal peptide n=1 Tax=Lysinibacter cavernae TaxID=1640652 RepID=A0A7X5R0N9_9MICO|nr:putative ribosomally synthesized peptide with SipW-like signal peptide [Lysinibacter cavernae]
MSQHPPVRNTSHKWRAVLAGGLVLGVGAAVTLAAWNDSEFATGTFTAGTFNLEGSDDGTAYNEHSTLGTADALGFTVAPNNLAPGDTVYAPFSVRLDDQTTKDAVVTVSAEASTGVVTNLTYTLVTTSTNGCNAAAVAAGTSIVAAGAALGSVPGGVTFDLEQGATGSAGEAVNLCFAVSAGSIGQGQSGTATWKFTASSE